DAAANDDVFSRDFVQSLVLQVPSNVDLPLEDIHMGLGHLINPRFPSVFVSKTESSADLLPSGPYFLQGKNIHQAWRLYDDSLGASIQTVLPDHVTSPKR
ncbi:MAG: hypothetical protein Q9195_009449, partial [Heterodermia aff. obscurata]